LFECVNTVLLDRSIDESQRYAIVIDAEAAAEDPRALRIRRESEPLVYIPKIERGGFGQAFKVVADAQI